MTIHSSLVASMASAAQSPIVVDASQCTLTARRRSVHVHSSFSRAMSGDELGLLDDNVIVREPRGDHGFGILSPAAGCSPPTSPSLTPMSHARVQECTTVTTLPRHNYTLPNFSLYDSISPPSSAPPTAYNSRAPSPEPEEPGPSRFSFDSMKWRLASGYFACFVTGWADGGTS